MSLEAFFYCNDAFVLLFGGFIPTCLLALLACDTPRSIFLSI